MRRVIAALAVGLLASGATARAADTIDVRLSYKIILNPDDGQRPINVDSTGTFDEADIQEQLDRAHEMLGSYLRGYRFQAIEIIDIGGLNGWSGPSGWFYTFIHAGNKANFEATAQGDPAYHWNSSAINIYIIWAQGGGGVCSFPFDQYGTEVVVLGPSSQGWLLLHELGHWFELYHTHEGQNACADCSTCTLVPGDDMIADTLPDHTCWQSHDGPALFYFGSPWQLLSPADQKACDDVYYNVMSYHEAANRNTVEDRMTELQLDHWADVTRTVPTRIAAVSGFTWFCQPGAIGVTGLSVDPFGSAAAGVSAANPAGGDIVILRPGTYSAGLLIDRPVTLRATRDGPATIGP